MKLVFLHGPPGVGKLTVARELQRLTDFALFHNHLAINMISPVFWFGTRPFIDLREETWLRVFRRASQERIPGLIFTFVFEPTVLPGFYGRVLACLGPDDALLPFELRCELDEHLRRVVQPERSQLNKDTDAEFIQRAFRAGDYQTPPEVTNELSIDTTKLLPDETARLISARIAT